MPVYEYTCDKCDKTTEALRKMDQADEPIACEHCGSKKTKRAHSLPASSLAVAEHVHTGPSCGRCGDPRGSCSN